MIQFDIGFKVDAKSLEGQLNTINKEIQEAFKVDSLSGGMSKEISNAVVQARSLEKAMKAATTDKGLSFITMNAELRKAGTNMNQVVSGLVAGGNAFKGSANEALVAFSTANRQAITLNKHLQEMGRVFLQSMKFTVAQQAIQGLQNMLQESYEWVVDLDSQLTQIQIVSGKTAQQMEAVSAQIVERSRALRVAASDYAEASQIYYQQGLQDAEVQRRADITIKAAQAANENVKSMSDMLTAIWNTYNMTGDQLENAASVGAKLGAETAIEFRDIAEAMQISATAASQMGVSYNSLASIIATVGSTTRQSASVIGNAYKTIFNNFQRLKVDGENGEVTLKAASQQLQALGINLLDASGQVKDLDEVIMQAGQNWKNYSENEQLAIAQLVGGTRQFGQFLALMNNFDTYLANLNSANMETGAETLEEQYTVAMESIEAKATNAAEAWQRAFSNFYDTDAIKGLIDLIADMGNGVDSIIESFGGLQGIITVVAAMGMRQLPKMFATGSKAAVDFIDNLTPEGRERRITRDVNAQFDPAIRRKQNDITKFSGDNEKVRGLKIDIDSLEKQKQLTLEMGKAQDQLNTVINRGTPIQRTQAEALKEELVQRQKASNEIIAQSQALAKLQAQQNAKANQGVQNVLDKMDESYTGYLTSDEKDQQALYNRNTYEAYEDIAVRTATLKKQADSLKLSDISLQIEDFTNSLNQGDDSIGNYIKQYNELLEAVKKSGQSMVTGNTSLNKYNDILSKIADSGEITSDQIKDLSNIIEQLGLDEANDGLDLLRQALSEAGDASELTEEQTRDLFNTLVDGSQAAAEKIKDLAETQDRISRVEFKRSGEVGLQRAENLRQQWDVNRQTEASLGSVEEIVHPSEPEEPQGEPDDQGSFVDRIAANIDKYQEVANSFADISSGAIMAGQGIKIFIDALSEGNLSISTFIAGVPLITEGLIQITNGLKALQAINNGQFASNMVKGITSVGQKIPLVSGLFANLGASAATAGTAGAAGMGVLAASIAAVAIPVAALIALFAFLWKESQNNSLEERLNRSREATENLKTATEEARAEAEALQQTFDNYKTASDTLDQCVKGTQEWRDALASANNEALNVLDALSNIEGVDISKMYSRDKDGRINISEEGIEMAQTRANDTVTTLDYATQLSSIETNTLANEAKLRETTSQMATGTTAYQAALYSQSGSFVAIQDMMEDSLTNSILNLSEEFEGLTDTELKQKLIDLGMSATNVDNNFEDYKKAIQDAVLAQNNLNEQAQLVAQNMAQQALGDEYSTDVANIASTEMQAAVERWKKDLLGENGNDGILGAFEQADWANSAEQEQELLNMVREALGDTSIDAASNFARGTDSNRSFAFIQNGEEVIYSKEQLANLIASSKALQELSVNAQAASQGLFELKNGYGDYGETLSDAVTSFFNSGSLDDITEKQYHELFDIEELVNEEGKITTTSVQKVFEDLGLSSEEAAKKASEFIRSLNDYGDSINDFDNKLSQHSQNVQDAYNKIDDSEMTYNERLTSLEYLEQAEAAGALEDALQVLKTEGFEGLSQFITELNNRLVTSFESAVEMANNLVTIQNSLKESREISQEDYDTLSLQMGSDLMDKYFKNMYDGTYMLIGSSDEFLSLMENRRASLLQEGLDKTSSQYDSLNEYQQWLKDNPYSEQALGQENSGGTKLNEGRLAFIDAYGGGDQVSDTIRNKINNEEFTSVEETQELVQIYNQLLSTAGSYEERQQQIGEELQAQKEAMLMMNTLQDAENAGIDSKEVLDLADGLEAYIESGQEGAETGERYSEALLNNEAKLNEVAKEQLRFNQALQDGQDNLEDWEKGLSNPDDIETYSDTINDLQKTYADLLDVDEGVIDEAFAADPENLELFNTVLNGTEEEAEAAYAKLSELALIDFGENFGLDPDTISSAFASMQDALAGLNVGDVVNLEGPLLDQMNAIIAALGPDVDAINNVLSMIGVDPITADDLVQVPDGEALGSVDPVLDEGEIESSSTTEATGWEPSLSGGEELPITASGEGVTEGQIGTVTIPGWKFNPVKNEDKNTETKAVDGYHYEFKPGTGSGLTKSSGRQKVTHGTNPSGSGRNPSGKGGGGGGGGKKSTYKKPTPKVRYTNRNNQIDRTKNTVDKLAQAEDQLYGKAKLAAMQKKSNLIVQQVKDYKALYDEAVAYREQDMQDLAATQLGQAVPMQIDVEGNILNQEEMDDYMREWKDRINAIEDEGAKEAEQRAYDVSEQAYTYYKEAQEKALEAMKEAVSQLGEWIQNEIEKRQYQMEIDIKVSDRQLSLLEFTLEELGSSGWITNWEDGLDNVIDQVYTIMDAGESTIDSTEKLIDLFDDVNNGGLEWEKLSDDMKNMFPKDVWEEANANGTLTNDILEAIGDNTDKLLDYAGQLTEAWVSAWEKIGEAMDSYLEQLERARSPLETQAEILETFISVADQVGWDVDKIDKYNELLDKQTDILEANYEASVKQAAATQDALDAMEPVYQDYLERFENGEITGQQFDVIQEQYYNLVDANQDAISQMTSDWSAYVENLQEKFEIAQQQIIKTWNDGIGNMWNDLAESQEGFDLFESLRTWYLDDFNKDYGLTTLTNQIEDAMDSISDPSRLKEYDDFMAEIVAKQEEGYELSQGELDVLNARFQLMQAQDAYEEAKNNKNTMRLTRDASGNYSYVYSSDSTENQEQGVLDAQKALHDAEEQYLSDSESRWYEWMLKKYDLVVNTDWELYAHDEEYRRQFQLQWDQLTQAMQNATNDVNNALTYTDRTYEETAIHHMTNTESMNQANAQYNEQFQILWDEIQAKYEETDQKVQESASLIIDSNLSLEDAANDLMGTIDDTMSNMMDTTDELADNMSSNMQTMIEDTASWSDSIIDEINAVIAKYKELYEMQTSVMQNHTGETRNYTWQQDETGWWYGDGQGGYMKSGWYQIDGKWYFFNDEGYMETGVADAQGNLWVDDGNYRVDSSGAYVGDDAPNAMNPNHTVGDWTAAVDTKQWGANYEDIANGQQNGGLSNNESDYIREYKWGVQNDEHSPGWHWDANEGNWWYATGYEAGQYVKNQTILYKGKRYDFDSNGWLTSDENGYAEGGYTGNKGIRGVDSIPAMLAPGEYVLNADDTTKILSAVQLLRGLSSGALTAAANAIAKLANGAIPQTTQSEQIPVQQDVHIEATFPNVSVASEIEDALNNLVNETVQLIGAQNSRRM